ncbi:hypothetical protein KBK19_08140 [Microvirga sp. STR05]|uniref:OmpH family outer membrane protein n=1 Tax=Hymenobacter duratus TaxID=2771356 RepID=A0ABR8JGY6_9BACT|nr:hypothetical protein [Hymenobacter duratus]MBD2715001.1 hypothetical protein [Hymenobacter duratus]MBR7949907.1 hypothetical protein [Microvirga sp. STR05]
MSTNLDYLNPNLLPLEDKVNAYLAAEKDLQRAQVEAVNLSSEQAQEAAAAQQFEQRSATGSFPQHAEEVRQKRQNLQEDLARLRQEIIELLPVRDEWVKVNLGYGPSRVGAFLVPNSAGEYELRVIQ